MFCAYEWQIYSKNGTFMIIIVLNGRIGAIRDIQFSEMLACYLVGTQCKICVKYTHLSAEVDCLLCMT
jgi:L-lactate utilization protein LutB